MTLPSISNPPTHDEVQAVFKHYAAAYALMESIQNPKSISEESSSLLPRGDQKTGCIGEYWAMRHARKQWPNNNCSFGHHSQAGWDIAVGQSQNRIQVKTVSEWSKTRSLSPIHCRNTPPDNAPDDWAPWTALWLIYLNKDLHPTGFWRIKRAKVDFREKDKLSGLKIRIPGKEAGGSKCLIWPKNTVHELLAP